MNHATVGLKHVQLTDKTINAFYTVLAFDNDRQKCLHVPAVTPAPEVL